VSKFNGAPARSEIFTSYSGPRKTNLPPQNYLLSGLSRKSGYITAEVPICQKQALISYIHALYIHT